MINPKAKKVKKYTLKIRDSDINDRAKFVSDRESLYIYKGKLNTSNVYVKAKQHGRYIYFESKFSSQEAANFFGLLGGLTGSVLASIGSYKARSIILDTKTGLASEIDGYGLHSISKEYPEIVRAYKKTKRKRADMENAIKQLNAKFE